MNYRHKCRNCQAGITKAEVQEHDGACATCYTAAQPATPATFTVFEKKTVLDQVYAHMESMRLDDDRSIASAFDMVEIRDVVEDLPALHKLVGVRLEPEAKCRAILEARARQIFKGHKAAPVSAICAPLDNYPELSIPQDLIKADKRPAVKVPVYGVMIKGEFKRTTRRVMLSCAPSIQKTKWEWTRPDIFDCGPVNSVRFCDEVAPDAGQDMTDYSEEVFN